MGQAYIGEIRMFAGTFAPVSWLLCNGQLVSSSDYPDLYTLIGTTYGGDSQAGTFNVPDLQGRVPMHAGNSHVLAEVGGVESVTLTTNQMPQHSHPAIASAATSDTTLGDPNNAYYGNTNPSKIYTNNPGTITTMQVLASQGGSQPHENMQPFLAITYIIATQNVYPSAT